jgi:hypothetical protein
MSAMDEASISEIQRLSDHLRVFLGNNPEIGPYTVTKDGNRLRVTDSSKSFEVEAYTDDTHETRYQSVDASSSDYSEKELVKVLLAWMKRKDEQQNGRGE